MQAKAILRLQIFPTGGIFGYCVKFAIYYLYSQYIIEFTASIALGIYAERIPYYLHLLLCLQCYMYPFVETRSIKFRILSNNCYICTFNENAFMHERLKQFLAMENIAPAQLAEILNVQRSGISHLLGGRNKPSFEFLQRMMTSFPELNSEWLILGKGRPYKNDSPKAQTTPPDTLFMEQETEPFLENVEQDTGIQKFDEESAAPYRAENRIIAERTAATPFANEKRIARIIVFFSDGTYEEK